jgi:hypothetical protein
MDYSTVVKQLQTNYNNIVTILSNLTSESSTCLLVSIARLLPLNRLRMRKQYGQLNENAISLIPSENALKWRFTRINCNLVVANIRLLTVTPLVLYMLLVDKVSGNSANIFLNPTENEFISPFDFKPDSTKYAIEHVQGKC